MMLWRVLGDVVLIVHLTFIVFVIFGGFLAYRWRWLLWIHLLAAVWASALEFGGWICPLTPLENWFRQAGGEAGYPGGFLEHYLLRIIYPTGLTPDIQIYLGFGVIAINALAYWMVWVSQKRNSST